MEAATSQSPTYVLTLDAVRWGIETLKTQRIHPFFFAYMHLCKCAHEERTTTAIQPRWDELGEHLLVPGGPSRKPYYRPVHHGRPKADDGYWLNANIAGSFSPSSLRRYPYHVIDTAGSAFSLKEDHVRLARRYLLYDTPVSAIAFSAFYFRDYGFVRGVEEDWDIHGLMGVFEDEFGLGQDYELLFTTRAMAGLSSYFEPLPGDVTEAE